MSLNGNNVIGSSGHRTNQASYEIDQSLRVDDGDSANLSRTPSSASNRKTWTWSGWVKRGNLATGSNQCFFSAGVDGSNFQNLAFNTSDALFFDHYESNVLKGGRTSTAVYRDTSAWYHIVVAYDTTQSTASDRIKIYVNGEVVSDFSSTTDPALNHDGIVNNTVEHRHFSIGYGPYWLFDGYLAEVNFIDGTALTPTSFGETNADTNQWVPIKYAGSYGTNGFYLKFQDSSALGDDSSGNTNDFTPTNLAATDQVLDSPTNNFATLNGVFVSPAGPGRESTLTEGNLKATTPTSGSGYNGPAMGTIGMTSGKWYFEWYIGSANWPAVGIAKSDYSANFASSNVGNRVLVDSGTLYGASSSSSGITYTTGDIIGCAVDMDNGKMWFSKNGTFISSGDPAAGTNAQFTDLLSASDMGSTGQVLPFFSDVNWSTSDTVTFNAGQDSSFAGAKTSGAAGSDFYYTPPTGFKALNTDNLSDPSIADPTAHFDTTLVSGNGSNRSITGLNFQPDFLWGKSRTNTLDHYLTDSVRGVTKQLYSNRYIAENSETVIYTAFNSDGFSLGTGDMNLSGQNYAHWAWKAGGSASTNEDGSIDSSVSANTTAGFSIVGWAGTGSNVTVGHGLSQAPELIINKSRTLNTSSSQWAVQSILWNSASDTNMLYLNGTGAASDDTNVFQAAPTATVFSPQGGGWAGIGASGENYIAYCFHSVEGYSKVGKYTGNSNADGPMFYCGFKPSWVMFKAIDSIQSWTVFDNKRNVYNLMDNSLFPDLNNVENDATSLSIDFVSNGIKIRSAHNYVNYSGSDYLVLAFAESPFKTSNAR